MKPLKLAWLNLTRRRIPTLIAVAAIAISVACSGILLRLNLLSQNRFSAMGFGGDALIGAKAGGIEMILSALNGEGGYPGYLPYKLFETLRAQQNVQFEDGATAKPSYLRAIVPFVYFAKSGDFRVVGTDESFFNRPTHPLPLASGRWAAGVGEVVLGAAVAEARGLKVGDAAPIHPWIGGAPAMRAFDLKVVGVLTPDHSAWDRLLYASVPTAQQILSTQDLSNQSIWGPNVLNYFFADLQPGGFAELASLVNRRTVGEAVLISEQKDRLKALTGTGETLGFFVSVLILALGGLSVTSMLITRFEAMSLQLAVLRAIGYSKRSIGGWLLWEGFLLGLAACVLGAALDGLTFPWVRELLGEALPGPEVVSSSLLQSLPIWATAIFATTASVFIPLYRVYHQDVHFSLRS